MKRKTILISMTALVAVLAALLLGGATTSAQSGGVYSLAWSTIDGGGGTSPGGVYSLSGTIGQPDAGALSGGVYTLSGGFWPGAAPRYRVFLPLVVKG